MNGLEARVQHLEAQVRRPAKKVAETVVQTASGYWNWIKPETIASGNDSQPETPVDLSGKVPQEAREVQLVAFLEYPVPGGSQDVRLTLYCKHPDVAEDIPVSRLFADDEGGKGSQCVFPIYGQGIRYKTVRTGSEGQFSFELVITAWR